MLHVDIGGTGSTVVLLHGVGMLPDGADAVVQALRARHRVAVVHMPGYGGSVGCVRTGVNELDVDVAEALSARGVHSAAVLGISRGAYLAVALSLSGKFDVTFLGLISPVIGIDAEHRAGYFALADALLSTPTAMRARWLSIMAGPSFLERDARGAAEIMRWFDEMDRSVVAEELRDFAHCRDQRPSLTSLNVPSMVMVGTADAAAPSVWGEAAAALLPNATLISVPGAGHSIAVEAPATLLSALAARLT